MRTSAELINQTSGCCEYYTPDTIVISARIVMGRIDLDPASSEVANRRVKAARFFTSPKFVALGEINGLPIHFHTGRGGLDEEWLGKVWINHPFGKSSLPCAADCKKGKCIERGWHIGSYQDGNTEWIEKMESEFTCGNMNEACCITYACTSEKWFQPLLRRPQCFLSPRTNYLLPDGTVFQGVTKGSVVTYFGTNVRQFADEFKSHGVVK